MKNIKSICNHEHSISNEQLENVAKIEFPEGKWQIRSEPPTCSYIQARWKNKNELSTNSDCYCPVGNKVEKIIDNQKMYKCDLLLNN